MGEYTPGLCTPWITRDEFLECCSAADETTPIAAIDTAINIASYALYYMSGRQFRGLCEKTVTVCRENCRNTRKSLHCDYENEIDLGFWPITELGDIDFDGTTQSPANFQINDHRYIEKLNGKWPTQTGEVDQEVVITFTYGINPPDLGKEAAKALASEILPACLDKECSLPDRATHIVRRGVSIQISDYKLLAQDFLNIYLVDLFLQAVNPTKTRTQAFVLQPGRTAKFRRKNT